MYWNHRVIKKIIDNKANPTMYFIAETFYNDDGTVSMISGPITLEEYDEDWGDGVIEHGQKNLKQTLKRMLKCLDKPVLIYEDIVRQKDK